MYGPYIYSLNGQNYHKIGSLVPCEGRKSSFAQLYIHDTAHKIKNKIRYFCGSSHAQNVDLEIVNGLRDMYDHNNVLLKSFHMDKDHKEMDSMANV